MNREKFNFDKNEIVSEGNVDTIFYNEDEINNDRIIDLRNPVDYKTEIEDKDRIMERRDIYFEQVRAIHILRKTFKDIYENEESFEMFCSVYEVNDGLKEDFKSALLSIILTLERSADDILKSKAPLEDYSKFLFNILTEGTGTAITKKDYGDFLNGLMEKEIGLVMKTLKDSRENPVLSHRERGFGKDEASKEGLLNAIKENISELEFDVRLSKDGRIIIHHNVTLGSSANRLEAINDLTWGELQKIELIHGEHLTTLDDFFEMVKKLDNQVTKINIDIKDFDTKMADDILNLIRKNHFEHRVNIVSWFPQTLQYLYEKEPNLHYSMSYFPGLRVIPKLIMGAIEHCPGFLDAIGSFVSRQRQKALANGNAKPQSEFGEFTSHSILLDQNKYWLKLLEEFEKNKKKTVGVHETAIGDLPVDDKFIKIMARVLHGGSLNIKVWGTEMSKLFDGTFGKISALRKFKSEVLSYLSGEDVFKELILKCSENNIKINVYDVGKEDDRTLYKNAYDRPKARELTTLTERKKFMKSYKTLEARKKNKIRDKKLEELKKNPGVMYSSNPDMVTKLDTRISKRSRK
ncbi:MAG: glycerophosphodiester phosphodiesterase family protein [Patescibacteria group bacterium]|nr:glycerophosphodiester phosphodiesterase family protein [Patescibacteria group bacterium]MDD4303899.1 glycerophosphodiester phosphodiesterase family protein [Patescibacteria group bacterium]MDD4695114.1 glycerophosphodiester phosphodiesterase family protein [Patescibacteria group bacterium]